MIAALVDPGLDPAEGVRTRLAAVCRAVDQAIAWKVAQEQRSTARFHRERRARRARARARRELAQRITATVYRRCTR